MNSLFDLYGKHAGKSSDKWKSYLFVYDNLLKDVRNKVENLLEIGVQNGGSLEIWSEYFTSVKNLIGCDINPNCAELSYENTGVKIIIGDASKFEVKEKITHICSEYDIVIDDGSHQSSDIIKSFLLYFPLVKEEGYYIIEDLHASYWQEFEGGLYFPYSSMSFLKKLADIVNKQHWGVPLREEDFLSSFFEYHGCNDTADIDYTTLHSVTFVNSICIIKKSAANNNNLGTRQITGSELSVYSRHKNANGSDLKVTPQNTNPWSRLKKFPEMEWENLKGVIKSHEIREMQLLNELETSANNLNQKVDELSDEIMKKQNIIEKLQFENEYILSSNSWKVTKPFRMIISIFKRH